MKQNRINDFKFFVPLEISKAKNESGEEVMKVAEIISIVDEDYCSEFIDL